MGRLAALIDAPGYPELAEPGFALRLTGAEIFSKGLVSPADNAVSAGWWNPPGSQWLTSRPWAFDGDWQRNIILSDHVVYASSGSGRTGGWLFAPNLSGQAEFGLHDSPSESFADDRWLSWYTPEAPTPPTAINFANLATACTVDFPAGIAVAAASVRVFPADLAPYFQWAIWPKPNDLFVFGFGNLAVVSYNDRMYLCRNPGGGGTTWELLGSSTGFAVKAGQPKADMFNSATEAIHTRSLFCIPVGQDSIFLMPRADSSPWIVPINTKAQIEAGLTTIIGSGRWWVAGYPGQKVVMQAQTVAWRDARHVVLSTGEIDGSTSKAYFNLGQSYAPTAPPVHTFRVLQHALEGESPVNTPIDAGYTAVVESTGETFAYQIVDETHEVWESDGTHFRGAIRLELTAATETAYLREFVPQIKEIALAFPVVLQDGPDTSLLLTDDLFRFKASGNLNDPEGKELTLELMTGGVALLRAEGLGDRHDYAVHILEDADSNGSYETLRIAAWCNQGPEFDDLKYQSGAFVQHGRIRCRGILIRLDAKWEHTTEINQVADDGKLAHTTAVGETLRQAAFDTDDTAKVSISTDPVPGDLQFLPGTMDDDKGEAGEEKGSAYRPDEDETKLQYVGRLRELNNWLLYELNNGKAIYQPNPIEGILDTGGTVATAATFYQTGAAAVAAGRSEHQKYERLSEEIVRRVECNKLRVTPSDPNLRQRILRDVNSIENEDAENYVGRWVRPETIRSKFAATDGAVIVIGIRALRRLARRVKERHWKAKLAPWQVGPSGIEVGSIVALEGVAGQFQIVSAEIEQLGPGVIETQFVGWKVPTGPIFVAP